MSHDFRIKLHPFNFTVLVIFSWFFGWVAIAHAIEGLWKPFPFWATLVLFLFWGFVARTLIARLFSLVVCPSCPRCQQPVVPHPAESISYRCPACAYICDTRITSEGD